MRIAPAVLLAVFALALGACGGDDNGGSSGDSSAQQGYTAPGESTTGSQTGTNGGGGQQGDGQDSGQGNGRSDGGGKTGTGGQGKRSNGEVPPLDLGNKGPAPKSNGRQRGNDANLPSGAPKPKGDFNGLALQIYESSLFFCNRAGVDGMRQEYGIKSEDPADVAREAARRNVPRGFPEAVYSGCLEGLTKSQ